MPKKWLIGGAAALVIAAGLGWNFGSPYWTLRQMQSAAASSDADAFSDHIDFPALREDLKAEFMAKMVEETQKSGNEFAGLGLAIGTAMIGPMIDNMVTPAGLRAMFIANGRSQEATDETPAPLGVKVGEDPVITRLSFDEFRVGSKDDPNAGIVFKRDGLSWKLSGIDLPATVTPGG